MAIFFHDEKLISGLKGKRVLKSWLKRVIEAEGFFVGDINIVLTSDEFLREINKTYRNGDYETDIITFDYTENKKVSGDLFVSLERIRENSGIYLEGEEKELRRVMVHGILHMVGYGDSDEREKARMKEKEDYFLSMLPGIE